MVHIVKVGGLSCCFNLCSLRETAFRVCTCPFPELNWSVLDDTLSGLYRTLFKILLTSIKILNLLPVVFSGIPRFVAFVNSHPIISVTSYIRLSMELSTLWFLKLLSRCSKSGVGCVFQVYITHGVDCVFWVYFSHWSWLCVPGIHY